MRKKLLLIQILCLAALATGCSLSPYRDAPQQAAQANTQGQHLSDTGAVRDKIYAQYREWKGTRYALGGMSKRGIDCSGLVYATYRDHLGIEIPRTTRHQSRIGRAIKRSDLRAGDLVFFKTGHKVRHVGIYIEDGKFFHASTSRGVTISRLSDYYWRDRYWHSRRVHL
ncbi:NlpC/P60 family protein [Microbulbifer sediminum]|uniref:NlpC/P60 family protein n=1 Tax=Microbulbifer sediminum TaxID=2904250 RepID=UPI001F3BE555|nr:NlpC/P60 family protein [Microbulbifer sediminum]